MSVTTLIRRANAAGITLRLVDGKVKTRGSEASINAMVDELRTHKEEIAKALKAEQDAAGTVRPPGLSEKMMAASLAVDRRILELDAYRVATGLFEKFKRPKPETKTDTRKFTGPVSVPNYEPTPKAPPWHHIDAEWHQSAKTYHQHHAACKTCQSAGQGRGLRCGTGAAMWIGYQDAVDQS